MGLFEVGPEATDPVPHHADRHLVGVRAPEDPCLQLAVRIRTAVRALDREQGQARALGSLPPFRLRVVVALPSLEPSQVGAFPLVVEASEVPFPMRQDLEVDGPVLGAHLHELGEESGLDPSIRCLEEGRRAVEQREGLAPEGLMHAVSTAECPSPCLEEAVGDQEFPLEFRIGLF